MKKKKAILLTVIVLAILTLAAVGFVHISFHGSIIKRISVTHRAKDYIEENFGDSTLLVDFAVYDFKIGSYFCNVRDLESEDTHFQVWEDCEGKMCDDYENRVVNKENVVSRLWDELDKFADGKIVELLPYTPELILCDFYGEITDSMRDKLTLDMPFDPETLPLPVELVIWVATENEVPSWEELESRVTELEKLTRDLPFDIGAYSVSIRDKNENHENDVCVYDIPASVIKSGGLAGFLDAERLRQEAEKEAIEEQ